MYIIIVASILALIGLVQFTTAFVEPPPALKWILNVSGGRKLRALLSFVPLVHRERVSRLVLGAVLMAASVSTVVTQVV